MADKKTRPASSTPSSREELATLLDGTGLFGEFTHEENKTVAHYVMAIQAPEGATVFREGEHIGHMCLLVKGRLELFKKSDKGERKKIAEVSTGKAIGEMSALDGQPYSATAVAAESSVLILLTRDKLHRIMEEYPRLGVKLLWKLTRLLSQRLRQTTGKLVDLL